MISADKVGDLIHLEAGPRLRDLVMSIPGARFKGGNTWTLPLGWGSALALRSTFGDGLTLGPDLLAWGTQMVEKHTYLDGVKFHGANYALGLELDDRLLPKQIDGAIFLKNAKHVVLGDEMRAGKSVMIASALRLLEADALPALIVAPNSMLLKWEQELNDWNPGLKIEVVRGGSVAPKREKQILSGADVIIMGWASFWRHTRLAPYGSEKFTEKELEEGALNRIGLRTVVADEAHRALSPKAKQTRAMWYLMHRAEYRWAATGTAVRGSAPEDVWAMGHLVAPYDYPVRSTYISRYTFSGNNGWGFEVFGWNPASKDEALTVFDTHFIRRTLAEVMPDAPTWLPPDVRPVEMTAKQAKAYKEMKKHMMTLLESGILLTGDPLVQLARLNQITDGMPVLNSEGEVVELEMPSHKIDALFDIIEEGGEDPLVVFAPSRKLIELADRELTKKGVSHVLLTGHTPDLERASAVARFQAGEVQVFLGTTGAGGEGITLSRSNRVLFLKRPYSLPENLQATARIGGLLQVRPMQVIDLVTPGTLEVDTLELVDQKVENLQSVLRDAERIRRLLSA